MLQRGTVEVWIDSDGERARMDQKSAGGRTMIFLRDGSRFSIFSPDNGYLMTDVAPNPGFRALFVAKQVLFEHKEKLDEGKLKPVREQTYRGKPVVVAELPDASKADPLRAFIGKDTGLTYRVEGLDFLDDERGRRVTGGTQLRQYSTIERLGRNELPNDLFSITAISGKPIPPTPDPYPSGPEVTPTVDPRPQDPIPEPTASRGASGAR